MEYDFRTKITSLLTVLTVIFCATFAIAQGIVTGSVSGTVEDPQGAVVSGARVIAKHLATNREFNADTSSSGTFTLRSLPPGAYDIKVQAPNFRAYESKGVVVNVGTETSLGAVKMEVGAATETLTVEGTAPLVESTTQQITNTFESKKVQEIPLGNSLDSFALFVPGVATAGDAGFSNTNGAELAVNGQRARSNNYQIDGQANNDNSVGGPSIFFGNQDAISELQIVTNYSAEYGRNMGAVVNYVTKSGTNQFHGSGYEFYQGSLFDSLRNQDKNPVFGFCVPGENPSDGCTVPKVSRFVDNRFGGTVGGPILKDKMWFFGSTNFERQRTGGSPSSSAPLITPTPTGVQQLQTAFPGNPAVNALATIGPTAVNGGAPTFGNLQTLPVTDGTTSANVEFGEITRFVPAPFNDYEGTGRVDIKLTSKDNFFGRYVFQQQFFGGIAGTSPSNQSIAQGDWISEPGRDQQIGLDWVRNWSNSFINQARASYSRVRFGFEGGSFPKCLQAAITTCPSEIDFGDGTTLGLGIANNLPQGRIINVYQFQDNASWQLSRHTVKIGGDYTKQRSPNVFLPNVNGTFNFADFNSFLANTPGSVRIVSGNPRLPFKENDLAFYVQDDWRIKDNLTLNLGLRWEWFQQAINLLHDRTVAQQTGPSPFWDTSLPLSRTTLPSVPQDLNNFSPVVGFAWTPRIWKGLFGDDKTVIRAGFRIGYDPAFYNIFLNTATNSPVVNAGQFPNTTVLNPPGIPAGGAVGTAVQAAIGPLVPTGVDPGTRKQVLVSKDFHNPYSEQWNFGIQRSIGQRVAAEVRYVGNHTVGNFLNFNANPPLNPLIDAGFANVIPAGLTPCADATQPGFTLGYADCTRTRVQERSNGAFSIYHSLQTELRVGGWHGVTATASYTFSKVIDNSSEIFSTGVGGNTTSFAQNPFDTAKAERGLSGIDYPHVFGLAFIYDLPFYKSGHGLLGHALGGWQLNSTYRFTTGQPYTTVQSRFAGATTSLCDPTATMSTFFDACRPILSNASLPLSSTGIFCDGTTATCLDPADPTFSTALPTGTLVDYNSCIFSIFGSTPCGATPITSSHWIVNDGTAATILGSPFKGVGRNTLRGQPISTVNLSMLKNTKITERITLQFRATAYNLLNTQFRGNPDPLLDDVLSGSFQNTNFNTNGGSTFAGNIVTDGIAQRRLEFGAKIIF
jgi:outer membrane receptor protein involved in Fe transport